MNPERHERQDNILSYDELVTLLTDEHESYISPETRVRALILQEDIVQRINEQYPGRSAEVVRSIFHHLPIADNTWEFNGRQISSYAYPTTSKETLIYLSFGLIGALPDAAKSITREEVHGLQLPTEVADICLHRALNTPSGQPEAMVRVASLLHNMTTIEVVDVVKTWEQQEHDRTLPFVRQLESSDEQPLQEQALKIREEIERAIKAKEKNAKKEQIKTLNQRVGGYIYKDDLTSDQCEEAYHVIGELNALDTNAALTSLLKLNHRILTEDGLSSVYGLAEHQQQIVLNFLVNRGSSEPLPEETQRWVAEELLRRLEATELTDETSVNYLKAYARNLLQTTNIFTRGLEKFQQQKEVMERFSAVKLHTVERVEQSKNYVAYETIDAMVEDLTIFFFDTTDTLQAATSTSRYADQLTESEELENRYLFDSLVSELREWSTRRGNTFEFDEGILPLSNTESTFETVLVHVKKDPKTGYRLMLQGSCYDPNMQYTALLAEKLRHTLEFESLPTVSLKIPLKSTRSWDMVHDLHQEFLAKKSTSDPDKIVRASKPIPVNVTDAIDFYEVYIGGSHTQQSEIHSVEPIDEHSVRIITADATYTCRYNIQATLQNNALSLSTVIAQRPEMEEATLWAPTISLRRETYADSEEKTHAAYETARTTEYNRLPKNWRQTINAPAWTDAFVFR